MNQHFQNLYEQSDDPWQVRNRWYEQRKRNLLLACLPAQRFRHAYEPACGNGELTVALARRSERVTASDMSPAAVRLTRRRTDGLVDANGDPLHVDVQCQRIPDEWPHGAAFDLIVISEMAYYLNEDQLHLLRESCMKSLTLNGALVLCHWRWPFTDRQLSTELVHDSVTAMRGLHRIAHHEEPDFLLDVWSRNPYSVAQREGISP